MSKDDWEYVLAFWKIQEERATKFAFCLVSCLVAVALSVSLVFSDRDLVGVIFWFIGLGLCLKAWKLSRPVSETEVLARMPRTDQKEEDPA